jgi:hypothetical protein
MSGRSIEKDIFFIKLSEEHSILAQALINAYRENCSDGVISQAIHDLSFALIFKRSPEAVSDSVHDVLFSFLVVRFLNHDGKYDKPNLWAPTLHGLIWCTRVIILEETQLMVKREQASGHSASRDVYVFLCSHFRCWYIDRGI